MLKKCPSIQPKPVTCALAPGHAGRHINYLGEMWTDGPQPVKKPRAPRSDKGKSRKVQDELLMKFQGDENKGGSNEASS
jgi:hypothetical protein